MRRAGNGPVAGVGAAGAVREIPMFTSPTEGTGRQEGGRRLGNREAPACGSINCCLRRSCGDVTMVFVFVAAVSHGSYKSKNFMPGGGKPNPIGLVPNTRDRRAVRQLGQRANAPCGCRRRGCGWGVPWRDGSRWCDVPAMGRWQEWGGAGAERGAEIHSTGGGHR